METAIYLIGAFVVAILYIFRYRIFRHEKEITVASIERKVGSWIVGALVMIAFIIFIFEELK